MWPGGVEQEIHKGTRGMAPLTPRVTILWKRPWGSMVSCNRSTRCPQSLTPAPSAPTAHRGLEGPGELAAAAPGQVPPSPATEFVFVWTHLKAGEVPYHTESILWPRGSVPDASSSIFCCISWCNIHVAVSGLFPCLNSAHIKMRGSPWALPGPFPWALVGPSLGPSQLVLLKGCLFQKRTPKLES